MSELLTIVYEVMSPIFLIIGLAALAGRILNPDPRPLSTVIVYLMMPALVFRGIAFAPLSGAEIGGIAGVVLAVSVLMAIIGMAISRFFNFSRQLESAFLVSVILMNAANYGTPINVFAYGDTPDAATLTEAYALFYYAMSSLFGLILGIYFASRGKASPRQAFMNVLKVPVTYAAIAGLLFNFIAAGNDALEMPLIFSRAITVLGDGAIPGMLVLLGLQLVRVELKSAMMLKPMLLAVAMRLIIAPLIAVPVALLLNLSGLSLVVAITQSAMPTAV
ncbi:MAG: AEC family transporter, partial [Aggregatilineales bacterium]